MNSFLPNNRFYTALFILLSVYTVGLIGIGVGTREAREHFLSLTPLNLLLTVAVLFWNHKDWSLRVAGMCLFVFLFGFFIEVAGVKTGWVFGSYFYGKTLGLKILDVPLMIGVNWMMLVYCIVVLLQPIRNSMLFATMGAAVMTLLDILIEPVAIRLDFWHWSNEIIPLQNYVAWFLVSFLLFLCFRRLVPVLSNRIAGWVLGIQFAFFTVLNLLLR
ncbi:MAG: carotenoid biosynthesis protein [Sphingobacteriales bacterium]|nr:carotenoid biosynthesis protein [Sphingobacteriales bacterium]